MQIQPPIINIFEKAVRKAGKSFMRDFGEIENLQIQSKNIGDFVTNADIKTEKILLETLKYYYPNSTYITEESGIIKGNEETIIIDPIDGTSNFIHGIPLVGIVIGRMFNGEITDGVIFNPILNEFYWSSKGKGAWCNNKRLRVSKREKFSDCVIGSGIPHANRIYPNYLNEVNNVSKYCAGLRCVGAASINLAYVAAGKLDGYWERNLKIWDVSTGVLIIKEAGGKITIPNGDEWTTKSKDILATNSLIHQDLREKIQEN